MKTYLSLLLFFIVFVACSDRTEVLSEDKEKSSPPFAKLSLKTKQSEVNIFDMVNFYIEPTAKDKEISMYDLKMSYDSLVVKTKGENDRIPILDIKENSVKLKLTWSNHYYLPGNYTAYLYGYKSNKVVLKDSVNLDIRNNKNFLNTNWKDFSAGWNIGYLNSITPYYFSIWGQKTGNTPSLNLLSRWDIPNSSDNPFYNDQNKNILKNYITRLYNKPRYTIEADGALEKVFNDNFQAGLNDERPLAIWFTSSTKIALIEYVPFPSVVNYKIYAEPVTK